jgi:hypothetical protein
MTLTRLQSRTCRECGRDLTDGLSLRYRTGPDCRKTMTGEQLRAAMDLTKAENVPGYIPPDRPASVTARQNHAAVQAAAEPPPTCAAHGGILGQCPLCRHEQTNPAARIIREIKALGHDGRRAERVRVLTARYGVLR